MCFLASFPPKPLAGPNGPPPGRVLALFPNPLQRGRASQRARALFAAPRFARQGPLHTGDEARGCLSCREAEADWLRGAAGRAEPGVPAWSRGLATGPPAEPGWSVVASGSPGRQSWCRGSLPWPALELGRVEQHRGPEIRAGQLLSSLPLPPQAWVT